MTTSASAPSIPSDSVDAGTTDLPPSLFDHHFNTLAPERYIEVHARIVAEENALSEKYSPPSAFTAKELIDGHKRGTTIPSWQVLEQELSIIRSSITEDLSKVHPVTNHFPDCNIENSFLECYLLYRYEQMLRCSIALDRLDSKADLVACHRTFDDLVERRLVEFVRLTYKIENLPPLTLPPLAYEVPRDSDSPVGKVTFAMSPPVPPPPPPTVRPGGVPGGPIPLTALALSGGGIRSATLSLGVLQSLASNKRLGKFDYLSTVSGGGYLGSWLKAWVYRLYRSSDPAPLSTVEKMLAQRPDAQAIHRLREYSNFLSPKLGAFSADTWTLVSLVARNLILNWLMFIPLALLVVALPWLAMISFGQLHTWTYSNNNHTLRWIFMSVGTVCFLNALYHTSRFITDTQFFQNAPGQPPRLRGIDRWMFLKYCGIPLVLGAIFFALAAPVSSLHLVTQIIVVAALSITMGVAAAANPDQSQRAKWAGAGMLSGLVFGILILGLHEILLNVKSAFVLHAWLFEGLWLTVPLALLSAAFAATIFIGVTSHLILATNLLHEWWAKFGGWILIVSFAWLGGVALTIILPMLLLSEQNAIIDYARKAIAAGGGLLGVLTAALGFFDSSAPSVPPTPSIFKRFKARLLPLGALLFAITITTASCVFILYIMYPGTAPAKRMNFDPYYLEKFDQHWDTPFVRLLLATSALSGILYLTSRLFNYSRFTLHALYRERLVRAYLGASNTIRNPDLFTGFDPRDNIRLHELRGKLENRELIRPFHLLNMTLNLSSSSRLDWQERKGESFTASMLHAGTRALGYQNVRVYAGPARFSSATGKSIKSKTGMTLGAAVAASGAAANPNMGYNSSPFVAFLLTVFNVRLGVWLPNPGPKGNGHHLESGPTLALLPALSDLLGMSDDKSKFVSLTDGGHFDNMGLYELVRRGVKVIVCVDGECDNVPKDSPYIHEGLAQSIRKCAIDFGVEIRSDNTDAAWNDNLCPKGYWLARIYYPHNVKPPLAPPEPGYLLYIKPRLFGDLPVDLRNYHTANNDFPQQTTADQWFSESQFESYRKLGEYIANSIPTHIWKNMGL